MSLSLVVLLTNSMGNTQRDSNRTKSLHIAEAGIDAAQNLLAQHWPADEASEPTSQDWADVYDLFAVDFPAGEFKRPATGPFIEIAVYDDYTDATALPADDDPSVDYPRNDIMVVESQAAVGDARTRIQVKVNRLEYNLQIQTGVALYSQGHLTLNGTGSAQDSTPIFVDESQWTATAYTQDLNDPPYTIHGQATFPSEPELRQLRDPAVTADSIFPQAIVEQLKVTAETAGQKYSSLTDEGLLKALESVANRVAWVTGDVKLTGATTFFSEAEPGILLVDGDVDLGAGVVFWGVIYAPNGSVKLAGGPEVHGMVIAAGISGTTTASGNRALSYNENVINNLNKMVTLVVRLVPGSWREIRPQ
jgi:hypothetical protein